jgi:hypothetical protein
MIARHHRRPRDARGYILCDLSTAKLHRESFGANQDVMLPYVQVQGSSKTAFDAFHSYNSTTDSFYF